VHPASVTRTVPWVAVVLAGGTSRRWGGRDKTALPLGGVPLLLHAVSAVLPETQALTVVAPFDHPARDAVTAAAVTAGRPLTWTQEEPPGSGPLAGLAAGLATLAPPTGGTPRTVAVLAGDLPFTRTAWPRLLGALAADPGADAAIGVDEHGRRQPLLAAHREAILRARLTAVPLAGRPLHAVTDGLTVVEVPVTRTESFDLDTPGDAAAAEHLANPRARVNE
jgi:molybdopterin-guanine dinucleotide biosynthesis protein A